MTDDPIKDAVEAAGEPIPMEIAQDLVPMYTKEQVRVSAEKALADAIAECAAAWNHKRRGTTGFVCSCPDPVATCARCRGTMPTLKVVIPEQAEYGKCYWVRVRGEWIIGKRTVVPRYDGHGNHRELFELVDGTETERPDEIRGPIEPPESAHARIERGE